MADVKFRYKRNNYVGLIPEDIAKIFEARKEGSIVREASDNKETDKNGKNSKNSKGGK